jgi:hypothetical protein
VKSGTCGLTGDRAKRAKNRLMASRRTGCSNHFVGAMTRIAERRIENVCVPDPPTCLVRAFHRVLPLPRAQGNPQQDKRAEGSKEIRPPTGEAARRCRWQFLTFPIRRSTCRGMALPNNSNGDSPRRHESVLGTLGSVPGRATGRALSPETLDTVPRNDRPKARPTAPR